MTSLKRAQYDVAITQADGSIVEHRVDVGPGDQLRAEMEGKKLALLPGGSIESYAFVYLCIYFALVRTKVYEGKAHTFIHEDCFQWEPVTDEAGDPALEPVGPTTQEGRSPSDSPSFPASEVRLLSGDSLSVPTTP